LAAVPPHPGILNYVEGSVSLDGSPLQAGAVGNTDIQQGQVLSTEDGRAEMLLTPGVFLRLGHNSAVRMVSPSLIDTRVELLNGSALVEAAQIHDENDIRVLDQGAQVGLLKKGLYRFNGDNDSVAVYDGKAKVYVGDESVDVKGGRQVRLNAPLQATKFDKKATEEADPLYAWSKLRSEYLSEASEASARTYVVNNYGFAGAGWYWNPWYNAYSFLPGSGLLYSPFGWGFYSPMAFYGVPYYYGPSYYHVRPWHGPTRYSRGINPGLVRPRGNMGHVNPGIGFGGRVSPGRAGGGIHAMGRHR
jgi:hypothetical protein